MGDLVVEEEEEETGAEEMAVEKIFNVLTVALLAGAEEDFRVEVEDPGTEVVAAEKQVVVSTDFPSNFLCFIFLAV